jgi:hypothetical protein
MDIEYLQNVMGSPYVNEGAFSRLKAKSAQAMGALGSTMGHQIQNPNEIKLRSLWEGFMSSLNRVMSDWQSQVSPMLGPDVKIPKGGKSIKNALDLLAKTITVQNKPIRNFDSSYNVDSPRSVRDNPETYGYSSDAAKLKTLTKEGLWDAAKRDMGLNKALASNNPNSILHSYKNHVLNLFKKFMTDAIKSTGLQPKQIYSALAKMQPKESGWQAAGNMQRVVQQLQKLQGAVPLPAAPSSAYSGPVPPMLPTNANPPSAGATHPLYGGPKPPVLPAAGATPPETTAAPSTPTTTAKPPVLTPQSSGPSGSTPTEDGFEIPKEDMPYVILKAMKLIIDAVKSDEDHALGLFGTTDKESKIKSGYPKLATSWAGGGASVTSSLQEADADIPIPMPTGYVDPELLNKQKDNDAIIHKEYPGEFIYNFGSRFNKYPSQPFSIQVYGPNESPDIKDNNGNVIGSVEVWWQSNGTFNKIYVVEVKDKKKSKPTLILSFADHQVSAKAGATTPGHINFFDLDHVLNTTNPNANFDAAPSSVKSEINGLKDDISRALLATTHRKSMEFVSKGWQEKKKKEAQNAQVEAEKKTSNVGEDGTLTFFDATLQKQVTLTPDQMAEILKGPREASGFLRKRLEEFGYFEKFPNSMPVRTDMTPIWKEARASLMSLGHTKNKSDKMLTDAWVYIKDNNPNASIWPDDANITAKMFEDVALKKKPKTKTEEMEELVNAIPAANSAVMAAETMGFKHQDALSSVIEAIKTIGKAGTEEDYTKFVLKHFTTTGSKPPEKTTPAAPPTAQTPKPAEEPPKNSVSAPVAAPVSNAGKEEEQTFKMGDTIDVSGGKFKIKDISAHNVVLSLANGTEYAVTIDNWNKWKKNGAVKHVVDSPKKEKGASSPSAPVSNPVTKDVSKSVSSPVSKSPSTKKPTVKKKVEPIPKDSDDIEGLEETVDYINPFRRENFL